MEEQGWEVPVAILAIFQSCVEGPFRLAWPFEGVIKNLFPYKGNFMMISAEIGEIIVHQTTWSEEFIWIAWKVQQVVEKWKKAFWKKNQIFLKRKKNSKKLKCWRSFVRAEE